MFDEFELPVNYRNEELLFPAQLQQAGYTHRFRVDVYGLDVFFEPDEEGAYRAIINPESLDKQVSAELLQAIAEAIEAVVR
ncbi:MAG TPA: hypothetical protein VMR70_10990 [Flavisolibacter sp.]|nr:hypothetical protein [Flavisolibacter sp.]